MQSKSRVVEYDEDATNNGEDQKTFNAITVHREQQRINNYVLSELGKLRQDNKRLSDEVLALRMENLSLKNQVMSIAQLPPGPMGLPITFPNQSNPAQGQQVVDAASMPDQMADGQGGFMMPYVQFDMKCNPPIIQQANQHFVHMLGYSHVNEILGKPWHWLIHDDYIERTIRMLQRNKGTEHVQFGQLYKTKGGEVVPAEDMHTFIKDEQGRMTGDLVVVRPMTEHSASTPIPIPMITSSSPYMASSPNLSSLPMELDQEEDQEHQGDPLWLAGDIPPPEQSAPGFLFGQSGDFSSVGTSYLGDDGPF